MGRRGGGQTKCWRCGGTGHVQTECPELSASPADGEAAAEGGARAPEKRCFFCGEASHLAKDCALAPAKAAEAERPAGPRVKQVVSRAASAASGHRMSVLVTTSPAVLGSFGRVAGLAECPLVIVCDGFNLCAKSTWKAGRVTEDAAARYEEYLCNLEGLLDSGALPRGTRLVHMDGRNGQALALQAGLRYVETPYVLVHQHDLEFTLDFGLGRVLDVLEDESNCVKYVGMPLLTNLHYEAIAWQHHGVKVAVEEHGGLQLVPVVFWYDSTHITSVGHYNSLETFGVRQRNDIMATGLAAHARYGTYPEARRADHCVSHPIPPERRPLICHLNGVRFLTPEQRAARGYPADPPVEFFCSRTMTSRRA
ncbi:unnamed protein product, partial [Prorocentrum cordatum]